MSTRRRRYVSEAECTALKKRAETLGVSAVGGVFFTPSGGVFVVDAEVASRLARGLTGTDDGNELEVWEGAGGSS
jgi:hypothetical protein